jgi:high-affinity Fe2+/Pb2+ permease
MQGNGNPNWQDKFLGGMILAGFVVVAIVAGLFSLATWSGDSRDHASTRPGQSNSATN